LVINLDTDKENLGVYLVSIVAVAERSWAPDCENQNLRPGHANNFSSLD